MKSKSTHPILGKSPDISKITVISPLMSPVIMAKYPIRKVSKKANPSKPL